MKTHRAALLAFAVAGSALAATRDLAPAPDPLDLFPEDPLRMRPTAWFLERWPAADFQVARPESFDDYDQFKTSELDYRLDHDVETVWQQYMTINPLRIWSTKRARIQAAYVPSLGVTLDRAGMEQGWPGFEEGMKIFVDMSSLPWAVSNKPAMMVALQIERLDAAAHLVVFRYLEGTPSYGEQRMSFRPVPGEPGATHVDHDTWFRSYSPIIEALYPSYHKKMIDEMHARFRWAIDADVGP